LSGVEGVAGTLVSMERKRLLREWGVLKGIRGIIGGWGGGRKSEVQTGIPRVESVRVLHEIERFVPEISLVAIERKHLSDE